MVSVDEQAIECREIATSGLRDIEALKNKDSLQVISLMLQKPILKCGKEYAIIDGATAYYYKEE